MPLVAVAFELLPYGWEAGGGDVDCDIGEPFGETEGIWARAGLHNARLDMQITIPKLEKGNCFIVLKSLTRAMYYSRECIKDRTRELC